MGFGRPAALWGEGQRGRPVDDRSRPIGRHQPNVQAGQWEVLINQRRISITSGGVTYRALRRSPSQNFDREATIDADQ